MEQVTHNTNKYEAFYESIIDFAIKLGLSDYSDFKGVDEFAITSFQKSNFIKFPLSIKVFLKYFGERMNIKSTGMSLWFTLPHIDKALEVAHEKGITFFLRKNKLKDFAPDPD